MAATKVGVREFREHFSTYLESKKPIHVTRHGSTMGVYVPIPRPRVSKADLEALRQAGEKVDEMLRASGISADELIEDFERARKSGRGKPAQAASRVSG